MKRFISIFLACLMMASIAVAGPIKVKKNAAYSIVFGMVDSADTTAMKNCTVTDTCYYEDGAGWNTLAITDTATQASTTGMYIIDLTAGEMNHNYIACKFTCTGGVDNMVTIVTTAVDVDDLVRSTTPANTLDVAATGEAGVDLSNVNGTLDAAEIGTDAITAAKIAADAIGASEIATDAIGAAEIAASAIGTSEAPDTYGSRMQLISSVADSGSTTTIVDAALTQANDYWNGSWAIITSGTTTGQVRLVTDFDAASDTLTVAPALTDSITTNTYRIFGAAGVNYANVVTIEGTDATDALDTAADTVTVTSIGADVVTAAAIATDAIGAAEIAADAIGASELATDAIGAAEIAAAAITNSELATDGSEFTAVPWNASWDAEVQSEVNDEVVLQGLDHLMAAAVIGTDVTDNSVVAKIVSKSATADWDSYANTTDALEATRDKLTDIETDTAEIGAAGAGLTALSTQASVDTIDSNVDAILVDTGTTLDTKINDIQGATFSSATDSLEAIRDRGDAAWTTGSGTGLTALASGTAQGGTAGTIQLAAGETFADDELNWNVVAITGGTGAGQSGVIRDYVGATDTASVYYNWITTPDATSTYEVIAGHTVLAGISTNDSFTTNLRDLLGNAYDALGNNIQANCIEISGDGTAADNAEAWFDDTGFVASNSTIGTCTTNTDMVTALTATDLQTALGTTASDVCAELTTTPGATPSVCQALNLLYMDKRNKLTTTSSLYSIFNDAGTSVMQATLTDDGTTFTKAEFADTP